MAYALELEAKSEVRGPVDAIRVLADHSGKAISALKAEADHSTILDIVSTYENASVVHQNYKVFVFVDGRFCNLRGKRPKVGSGYVGGYLAGLEHFLKRCRAFESKLNDPHAAEAVDTIRNRIFR